jgi:hypothetical protein
MRLDIYSAKTLKAHAFTAHLPKAARAIPHDCKCFLEVHQGAKK